LKNTILFVKIILKKTNVNIRLKIQNHILFKWRLV